MHQNWRGTTQTTQGTLRTTPKRTDKRNKQRIGEGLNTQNKIKAHLRDTDNPHTLLWGLGECFSYPLVKLCEHLSDLRDNKTRQKDCQTIMHSHNRLARAITDWDNKIWGESTDESRQAMFNLFEGIKTDTSRKLSIIRNPYHTRSLNDGTKKTIQGRLI
jgi:hypothetical protein